MGRFIQNGTGVVVSVADSKDARFASGWKPYGETGGASHEKSETPDSSWTVPELKAHAEAKSIDLDGAKKKPEILAAIAAFVPPAGADESDDDESDDDDESQSDDDDSKDE